MTKAPGESPGSSSLPADDARDYRRPGLALLVAAIAFVLTAVLVLAYPSLRYAVAGWPQWLQSLADLVILSAPLVAGVFVAARLAADGFGRAVGIRRWRWTDAVLGLLAGVVVRALVELVEPTTGSLLGPFVSEYTPEVVASMVVVVAGAVLITPVIEELFFRGLVLRALVDLLGGPGSILGSIVALLASATAFSLLHVLPWGGSVPLGLLVGTLGVGVACGILTLITRRLGGAIIAHIVFNATGIALLLV